MTTLTSPALTLAAFDTQATAQTDTELIAAQSGKKIAVYQVYVTSDTAITVTFETGAVTVWKQFVAAGGGSVVPFTGVPWFVTGRGEALTYTTSGNAGVAVAVKAAAV